MNKSIQDDGANGSIQFINVVAAVIRDDKNRFLIAKRKACQSNGGLWEFPGGKVEQGETEKEALVREIREELGVKILVLKFLKCTIYKYPNKTITLYSYYCEIVEGTPTNIEHDEIRFVPLSDFDKYEFSGANKETIELLQNQLFIL